jgi:hypothetical protein
VVDFASGLFAALLLRAGSGLKARPYFFSCYEVKYATLSQLYESSKPGSFLANLQARISGVGIGLSLLGS